MVHHILGPDAGAPGATLRLAAHLTMAGHEVETLSFDQLPAWMGPRQRIVAFPFAVAHQLGWHAPRRHCDVIDASTGDTWLWGLLAGSRREVALVTRSHGLEHRYDLAMREEAARGGVRLSSKYHIYHGGWRLREVALSLRHSDMIIVPNRADAAYCVNDLGIAHRKVCVVHHGLPEAFIGLPPPRPWSPPAENLRIAWIGRYLPMKGSHYATVALSRFLASWPNAEVTFLGPGIPTSTLIGQFDRSNQARLRVVTDYKNVELPHLLRGHHILLFPTLSEGFPLALIEGMACGLAPVVGDAAGALETATDEVNSLVVRRADALAIENALARLAADPQLLNRLRHRAQATARRFTWAKAAGCTAAVYQQAIANRHASQRS